jgi:Domain of unknown function (DUF4157)/DNA/RNA non-specific endonuclease
VGERTHTTVERSSIRPGRAQATAERRSSERRASPERAPLRSTPHILQAALAVGPTDDPYEREAERTAELITGAGAAAMPLLSRAPLAASLTPVVMRAVGKRDAPTKKDDDKKKREEEPKKPVQRASVGEKRDEEQKKPVQRSTTSATPQVVPHGVEAGIEAMIASGGTPLAPSTRAAFEPRFGYDFASVRVHTDPAAAGAAAAIEARAFTVGDHIFFGAGHYQPSSVTGSHLLAHELTHTIQQQPSGARQARLLAGPRLVQRDWDLGLGDKIRSTIRDYVKRDFPPWELITLIIGWDPLEDRAVKGSTRDWIHAALMLAPDGPALFERLDKEGKIDELAKWWDARVAELDLSVAKILALIDQAKNAVSATDILHPLDAWNKKIKPIFEPTIKRVFNFILAVGAKVFAFLKDLILHAVADWAKEHKGYPLLTFILGKDPITNEEVKRDAKGLIFAVLDLIPNGDKIKENLEKSKTIEKTAAWFKEEVKKLNLTWDGIKKLFQEAWDAFKVADLLTPKTLFDKMWAIFGPPLGRLLSFLLAVGKKVLEFVFEGAMFLAGPIGEQIVRIFHKIGDTFNKIVEDPVAFVHHLVDAVKLGFQQFGKNIWEHLKTGLIEWLVGALEGAGLVLPKVWDLKGIVDLILQVLGITYAKMRAKLVKVIGEDRVAMLERIFAFIKTLVTEGPAAAWQQIVDAISGLWDMVIGGIKDWAVTKIVTAAITKLATMFNPAGAVIQAIIATYNTIAFFVERIKQILALVEAIVDSIANIAAGKLTQAANFVERAMARTIPVILGFLARLIGLGDVSGAIKKVIEAIQQKVDKAIDAVIAWIVEKVKSLFGAGKEDEEEDPKWSAAVIGVGADVDAMAADEKTDEGFAKRLPDWKQKYGFTELTIEHKGGDLEIDGSMSPKKKPVKTVPAPPESVPKYGPVTAQGYGTSVFIGKISSNPTGGSTPSVSSDPWQRLGKRRNDNNIRDYYYVRGHLLNHNLGGPGNTWDNLTPLTQVANNRGSESMLRSFEQPIKDAVTAKKVVTNFDVQAQYGSASRSAELAEIDKTLAAAPPAEKKRLETVRGVIEDEQYVPLKVVCKAVVDGKDFGTVDVGNDPRGTKWQDYKVAV